ncbi:DUF3040 domain-containing protein [Pseudonocardia sp. H11422]|uniref:DUF3040 domain-containing protein n=1 Tax=Pseudonocardia sp. H11422 TaxID=2835866 RepID=UPI0020296F10|nr:DUF3040 domain-containing protein [Pseudonocardia sp. H11422]
MALSPREQSTLAAIENGLSATDPALVAAFTRARSPSPVSRLFPLSARHTGLLILALLTLIVLHPLALQLGMAGPALLTGMLIVPWIVSASRATKRRYDGLPRSSRTGTTDQDVVT